MTALAEGIVPAVALIIANATAPTTIEVAHAAYEAVATGHPVVTTRPELYAVLTVPSTSSSCPADAMAYQRVDLTRQYGVDRLWRWQTGSVNAWNAEFVTVGRLADGRWFADSTRDPDRAISRQRPGGILVGRLICDGRTWQRWPAAFDGSNQPVEPGRSPSGQSWSRRDEPESAPSLSRRQSCALTSTPSWRSGH